MGDFFKNRIILILLGLLLLIIFLFVFTRFRSLQGNDTDPSLSAGTGNPTVYENGDQVQLSCTDDCRGHGQCGNLANGDVVILTSQTEPQTQNHSVTVPNMEIVDVTARRSLQTVGVFDARRVIEDFYQISWGGLSTWAAGWCVVGVE